MSVVPESRLSPDYRAVKILWLTFSTVKNQFRGFFCQKSTLGHAATVIDQGDMNEEVVSYVKQWIEAGKGGHRPPLLWGQVICALNVCRVSPT